MRLVGWLLLGVLASCTCSGTQQPARFTFTSQGDGPTNTAPLNPLRVGALVGVGTQRALIDGFSGPSELRLTSVFSGNITRVLTTADGLFFAGSTVDGISPTPILVVPAKVRLGMKWDVFTDGDTRAYGFEVTAREELADSVFGPGTLWQIDQTDAAGVVQRRYLEGHGRIDEPALVMWNQDPTVAPETAPKVELEPITTPATFGKRGWVETVSMIRVGNGPALLTANDEVFENGGNIGFCGSLTGSVVTEVAPTPGAPFRRTQGLECVSTQYCAKVTSSVGVGVLDCSLSYVSGHASGVVVGSDGQLTWLPRANTGELAYGDLTRSGNDFSEVSYRGIAVVPDAAGKGNVLFSHFAGYGDLFALGDATRLMGDPSQPRLVANSLLGLQDLVRVTTLSDDTGGRNTLLLQTRDGMVWSSVLEGAVLSRPVRHVRLAGRLAVQATEKGNEVLRVTGDGLVQRVRIDAQGLGLDPVAQLTLPAGEQAHSAFLLAEGSQTALVVATIAPDGRDPRGALVKLNLYRSKAPVTPQATVRPQRANGVYAVSSGPNSDALVCWSGDAATSGTGWSIGGKPALAVASLDVGGPCVLVVRPPGPQFSGEPINGSRYFTVEGPIPGQGLVTVRTAITPNVGLTSATVPPVLVPLKGGGFVSGRRLYGAGGVLLGVPSGLLSGEPPALEAGRNALADAAGNGLWVAQGDEILSDQFYVRRVGFSSLTVKLPVGVRAQLKFASGGGGVVATLTAAAMSRDVFIGPDGTMNDLPTLPPEYVLLGRQADGTLCGWKSGAVPSSWCRNAAGVEVSQPLPADLVGGLTTHFFPSSDGQFVMMMGEHRGLDPATARLIDMAGPQYGEVEYAFGADGSVWGLVTDPLVNGKVLIVRFTRDGVVEVPPPPGQLPSEVLRRLYVDQQVLIVIAQNNRIFTLARP